MKNNYKNINLYTNINFLISYLKGQLPKEQEQWVTTEKLKDPTLANIIQGLSKSLDEKGERSLLAFLEQERQATWNLVLDKNKAREVEFKKQNRFKELIRGIISLVFFIVIVGSFFWICLTNFSYFLIDKEIKENKQIPLIKDDTEKKLEQALLISEDSIQNSVIKTKKKIELGNKPNKGSKTNNLIVVQNDKVLEPQNQNEYHGLDNSFEVNFPLNITIVEKLPIIGLDSISPLNHYPIIEFKYPDNLANETFVYVAKDIVSMNQLPKPKFFKFKRNKIYKKSFNAKKNKASSKKKRTVAMSNFIFDNISDNEAVGFKKELTKLLRKKGKFQVIDNFSQIRNLPKNLSAIQYLDSLGKKQSIYSDYDFFISGKVEYSEDLLVSYVLISDGKSGKILDTKLIFIDENGITDNPNLSIGLMSDMLYRSPLKKKEAFKNVTSKIVSLLIKQKEKANGQIK